MVTPTNQARSQDFAKGRLFSKLETTVNELDPNFSQSWIRLRRFFCQNQVISKKKVFTEIQSFFLTDFGWAKIHFSGRNSGKFFTTSAPQFRWGGLFSFLEQKSASKALKLCWFAYFSARWGGYSPPAPLATLLLLTMLLPKPDLHWVGPLTLWDFRNIFFPNAGEDQKKSYMSAGHLVLCHLLNPSLVIALRS